MARPRLPTQPPGDGEQDDDEDIAEAMGVVAIPLARVPDGIAAQSMAPGTAATRPVMMPAAIIGRDA